MNKLFISIVLIFFTWNMLAQKELPLFTLLSPEATQVDFENRIKDQGISNIFIEQNYYNGGGVGLGDINNDGLIDLFLTGNQVADKLYLNLGNLKFQDITEQAGIIADGGWSTGVAMVDINNDGFLDIYVCRDMMTDLEKNANKLYINKGNLTFKESAKSYGLDNQSGSVQATFFDYDKDGDQDVFLVNHPPNPGYFGNRAIRYDLDSTYCSRLYQNNRGTFTDVSLEANVLTFGYLLNAVAADINNDGWVDLYATSDFITPDFMYLNQGDGTFKNTLLESVKHTSYSAMGSEIADIDNDGLLDIMAVDMVAEDNRRLKSNMGGMYPEKFWEVVNAGFHYQYMVNTLQWNRGQDDQGKLYFSEIAQLANIATTDWSWAPLLADFDNDGLKDLFITNGFRMDYRNPDAIKKLTDYSVEKFKTYQATTSLNERNPNDLWKILDFEEVLALYPSEKLANYIFKNKNGLQFEKVTEEWGLSQKTFSNGAAYGDLDNDGDLDLVVNNINDPVFIYQNNASQKRENNYLSIQLSKKEQPHHFLGAKAQIEYRDRGQLKKQYIEMTSTRGFQSSSVGKVHFGLGKAKKVDKIQITWGDGNQTIQKNVKANRLIKINQQQITQNPSTNNAAASALFEDQTAVLGIDYLHRESIYDDYAKEVLLPHKMSTLGPFVTVGDINGDGLEDFFVGGAAGESGHLFIQESAGKFKKIPFKSDANLEDTGGTFFDADNDGDLDLYVCSGSNEFETDYAYQDRLYLNDGKGVFVRSFTSIPWVGVSGAVVKPFDFDFDGDLDLFVGGRQVPSQYPSPANSYLFRNEGVNKEGLPIFSDLTEILAPEFKKLGMVTDAIWMDYDADNDSDLIIVGEWMPITIFNNENGVFKKKKSIDKTGWWYAIEAADFDKDGDKDLILGNLGLNYKYKASQTEPFEVFYDDFDSNASPDIVLSYYNFGEKYPVRGRSCSAEQIPSLKEKFSSYTKFANATLEDIYGKNELIEAINYQAKEFASLYAENLGNGKFRFKQLPLEAQIAAINDFLIIDVNKDGNEDIIMAGGLYDAEIETARSDASLGLILLGNGKGDFTALKPQESGLFLDSNVRDLAFLKTQNGNSIISASNKDQIIIYNQK
jgi:hypothetical protein